MVIALDDRQEPGVDETGSCVVEFPTHDICPGCGAALPPFSACEVCATDEADDDASSEADEDEQEGASANRSYAQPRAHIPAWPFYSLLGGFIAAACGLLVELHAGHRLGLFTLAIGAGSGAGACLGMGRRAGASAGTYASAVTLVCMLASAIGWAAFVAAREGSNAAGYDETHKAMAGLANELVTEWEAEGKPLVWPRSLDAHTAETDLRHWPYGYPASIEEEVRRRWDELSADQRQVRIDRASHKYASRGTLHFFLSNLSYFDAVWGSIAIVIAYILGTREKWGRTPLETP